MNKRPIVVTIHTLKVLAHADEIFLLRFAIDKLTERELYEIAEEIKKEVQ